MNEHLNRLTVMQGYLDGKTIEAASETDLTWIEDGDWEKLYDEPDWEWEYSTYRIKP